MEQVRGNGSNVTYSGVKYHQVADLDHGRGGNAGAGGGTSSNYVSASSKYQTGMTQLSSRQVDNDQLSEMERAHAKYQIEMEMARQKYQSEIEQAAAKYQSEIEQARGNMGSFIGMKYQQVTAEDMDKAREQEVHYKYQSVEMDQVGARGNTSNSFVDAKYHNAFRPSPDLQQQQQQQQQQTANIPVNTNYGSPMEYHQCPTPTATAPNNNAVTNPAPPPAKKRKKKPVDMNKIRKRCVYQRRMWTNIEREAVMRQLGDFLSSARLPGKKDIEEALQREDILGTRSWKNIKDFIRNKTTPRIPRRSLPTQVQSLPTQVPVVQAGHQQATTSGGVGANGAGTMVMTTNNVGQMVTIPITAHSQHAIDSKQGLIAQQQQQQQQQMHQPPQQQQQQTGTKKRKKKTQTSPEGKQRRVISRRDWSGAEKGAVLHYFGDYVAQQKLPGKKEIEECLQKEDILAFRTWRNVKDFIRNTSQAHIKREAIFGTSNPDFALLS